MGKFITFEGIEGCGKSTQIQLMAEWLTSLGRGVTLTREPGGTVLGERIREFIKTGTSAKFFSPKAELLLFEASRIQHVEEIILPALGCGNDVLCDRFYDSSTVYQGAARRIPWEYVSFLNNFASGGLVPDFTVLIDITPEESVARLAVRGGKIDRIELESMEFFRDVREGYLLLARSDPRFLIIDGCRDIDDIRGEIMEEYRERFL
jgi:dTMP kinase